MERQEALKRLAVAGMAAEARKVIEDAVDNAERSYRQVRENRDLSDEARRRHLAEIYAAADRELTEKLVSLARRATTDDRDDAEAVFGTKGIPGDPATLAISRRDAADRVEQAVSREERRELLARATRSNDEVLARAVVEKAVIEHDVATVNQFIEDRPRLKDAVERLWKAENAGQDSLSFSVLIWGLRPFELEGMTADQAATLARS